MGRAARGVKAMKLKGGDRIISCEIICPDMCPLLVSETGIGKRTDFSEFTPSSQRRRWDEGHEHKFQNRPVGCG